MNTRKPVDYSGLFAAPDTLLGQELPQMERYREMGREISGKGTWSTTEAVQYTGEVVYRQFSLYVLTNIGIIRKRQVKVVKQRKFYKANFFLTWL